MTYHPGDQRVIIDGQGYSLRLTLGALAEISERLSASSPKRLSHVLRTLSAPQARILLTCLSVPRIEHVNALALSDAEVAAVLPSICSVFEKAFTNFSKRQNAQ